MNRLNDPSPPALYRVGGRLYKTTALTSTDLRLEDLLDGQCLVFSRDQARQMIQQQDLIKVKHSTYRRLCQIDPRYRPHLPSEAPVDAPQPWAAPTVQRAATPWPPLVPRDASADSDPGRHGAEERPLRSPRRSKGQDDGAAQQPAERVHVLIVDEFRCFHGHSPLSQADIRALLERCAPVQRLTIRTRTQHPLQTEAMSAWITRTAREERWLDTGQVHPATPPGWLRLKSPPSMTGSPTLTLTLALRAIARRRPTEPE